MGPGFDAIVLAGGAAHRMDGVDKPMLEIAGRPMLVRVLDAVARAQRRIVVGPRREVGVDAVWCREDPPGGGPVAAIEAALPHVHAGSVLVLAGDLPWIAAAIGPLRDALPESGADVAMLATDGHPNYLAAAWRTGALRDAMRSIATPAGASMRTLVAGVRSISVDDAGHWGDDCDTWADVTAANDQEGSRR